MTHPTRTPRILIVDGHPDQLHATMSLLTAEGYEAIGCSSTFEALPQLKTMACGVAVVNFPFSDLIEPEFLEQLKQASGRLMLILNTGSEASKTTNPTVGLENLAYIERAHDPGEFVRQINRAMCSQLDQCAKELEKAAVERTATSEDREERFRQLVDHIHEVFWLTSADQTQMFYVSPAYETIWGKSCASLYENPSSYLDSIDPEDFERVKQAFSNQGKQPFQEEYRIVKPDGSIRWVLTRAFPVPNAEGKIYRVTGLSKDITDRKRAEEALKKTERQYRQSSKMEAIGTLAGGIAHDFNNILTAILGYTELALATVPKESRTQRNLQEVLTAGHRAKHLVQQILTFSRQSGLEQKPVQIHRVVGEAMKLLRASIPTTIEIRQQIHSESTILGDYNQMHQMIVNLCTNAEYSMRETGGVLSIVLDDVEITEPPPTEHPDLKPGPHVRLMVKDTGQGLSPETLERMFDPFFTTKPIGEGSGMGLAVVHGIITAHGGSVSAESTQGNGTKIEVYLPTITEQVWKSTPTQEPLPYGKESILFVDDEEALVRLGQELLTHLGYTVEVRTSSVHALELFQADPNRFDLVITDQTMPNLTGESLTRELLRIRPGLPIILCTGFSHTLSAEKAKTLGIRAYLMKPLAIRDLAPIVRHVLDEQVDPVPQ